jgi:signal transduction histidine kinase
MSETSGCERLGPASLLDYTRALQGARDYHDLIEATQQALKESVGYNNVWLFVMERQDSSMARMVGFCGPARTGVWESTSILDMDSDPMLREIRRGGHVVVVADATTDPRTNKDVVELLGSRTIINVPLLLVDAWLGVLGIGTYGDEGFKPPTQADLDHIAAMTSHLSVALARIRLLEDQAAAAREKAELERKLLGAQRLESIGLLAGGVAHDFNNLLTIMLGNSDLMDRETLTGEQRARLEGIVDAAQRAAHLTRQLLSMSRQQRQNLAPLDLNESLSEVAKLLARLLPETLDLEVRVCPDLPTIEADRGQIEQVIMNLCLNARDAMPKGGRLRLSLETRIIAPDFVTAHPWAREGRVCVISIQDTGAGMNPEVLAQMYDPFFTTKPPGMGTGLGLAVVHGIVASHGGFLHCDSEPGKGTTFSVFLPVHGRASEPLLPRSSKLIRGGDERVLVADDQAAVRDVIHRLLRDAGYRVRSVADGHEALLSAQEHGFDLVILDVVMPGMTCREICDRIHALQPEARFLFVSGHTSELVPADLLAERGVSLLEKPFGAQRLLEAVREVLAE